MTSPLDRLLALRVGQTERLSRTITAEDVATFARLTGDFNALHVDDEYAARYGFRRPVAHGFLHASLLSALIGMKLPGEGALYLSQSLDFTRPVFVGDTVTARGRIERIDREARTVAIRTTIVNQHGETVLDGNARVKVAPTVRRRKGSDDASPDVDQPPRRQDGAHHGRLARHRAGNRARAFQPRRAHRRRLPEERAGGGELVSEIEQRGGTAAMVKADITDVMQAAQLVEQATTDGGLDILVNNAGPRIASGTLASFTWAQMQHAYDEIVGGVFTSSRRHCPHSRNVRDVSSTFSPRQPSGAPHTAGCRMSPRRGRSSP